jgi:hypothetical protein
MVSYYGVVVHPLLRVLGICLQTICPNLEVLDISNAVFSSDFISLDIEKLQRGCPLLKILRLTNSQFRVSYASAQEKVTGMLTTSMRLVLIAPFLICDYVIHMYKAPISIRKSQFFSVEKQHAIMCSRRDRVGFVTSSHRATTSSLYSVYIFGNSHMN